MSGTSHIGPPVSGAAGEKHTGSPDCQLDDFRTDTDRMVLLVRAALQYVRGGEL